MTFTFEFTFRLWPWRLQKVPKYTFVSSSPNDAVGHAHSRLATDGADVSRPPPDIRRDRRKATGLQHVINPVLQETSNTAAASARLFVPRTKCRRCAPFRWSGGASGRTRASPPPHWSPVLVSVTLLAEPKGCHSWLSPRGVYNSC